MNQSISGRMIRSVIPGAEIRVIRSLNRTVLRPYSAGIRPVYGVVSGHRIPALYGRNTALFNDHTVRISVPKITDRIRSRILRPWISCFIVILRYMI